eukprot:TRINITY_DN33487_c0_g1_i1.p1 TRINITY_DN33487_c0_g1~~TRINITY_DN33487_c0_g1_i1.p1  ORF type:complete len:440 (+),score=116.33 TRINITY_DN33487_c0_g1_i1:38-1321(+)
MRPAARRGAGRGGPAQSSRYLEEIHEGSAGFEELLGTWIGEDEDDDGTSVQSERLELRDDGSFVHTLGHIFPLARDPRDGPSESACSGRWRLYNVRFFGADLSVDGDREICFERGAQSPALHTKSIVVCGTNPRLNGFLGKSCRLKFVRPDGGIGTTGGSGRARVARASANSDDSEDDIAGASAESMEAEARKLSEATGRPLDLCLAVLLECGCVVDAAAVKLLELDADEPASASESHIASAATARAVRPERPEHRNRDRNEGGEDEEEDALPAEARAAIEALSAKDAAQLAEVTGESLETCRAAVRARPGVSLDLIAADLLAGLCGSAAEASAAEASIAAGSAEADVAGATGDAAAEMEAEASGEAVAECDALADGAGAVGVDADGASPDRALAPSGAGDGLAGESDEGDEVEAPATKRRRVVDLD